MYLMIHLGCNNICRSHNIFQPAKTRAFFTEHLSPVPSMPTVASRSAACSRRCSAPCTSSSAPPAQFRGCVSDTLMTLHGTHILLRSCIAGRWLSVCLIGSFVSDGNSQVLKATQSRERSTAALAAIQLLQKTCVPPCSGSTLYLTRACWQARRWAGCTLHVRAGGCVDGAVRGLAASSYGGTW